MVLRRLFYFELQAKHFGPRRGSLRMDSCDLYVFAASGPCEMRRRSATEPVATRLFSARATALQPMWLSDRAGAKESPPEVQNLRQADFTGPIYSTTRSSCLSSIRRSLKTAYDGVTSKVGILESIFMVDEPLLEVDGVPTWLETPVTEVPRVGLKLAQWWEDAGS